MQDVFLSWRRKSVREKMSFISIGDRRPKLGHEAA
jgi:hypothetical protein